MQTLPSNALPNEQEPAGSVSFVGCAKGVIARAIRDDAELFRFTPLGQQALLCEAARANDDIGAFPIVIVRIVGKELRWRSDLPGESVAVFFQDLPQVAPMRMILEDNPGSLFRDQPIRRQIAGVCEDVIFSKAADRACLQGQEKIMPGEKNPPVDTSKTRKRLCNQRGISVRGEIVGKLRRATFFERSRRQRPM
ncbi:MAG TPA: hypothetical protein VK446_14325 [Methylocystis sp.]|nr:hypothetical protein [Methylocystis sp.]